MDLTMLESCTAADDTTVEFKLNKPCVTFIYTVAQIGIVPEKSYSDKFGLSAEETIGSGPYKLTQWDKGQQFILEANENYYGEQPAIKKGSVPGTGGGRQICLRKSRGCGYCPDIRHDCDQ